MSRYDYYGGWRPYVSVAQRRANARKEMQKLQKKGKEIQPVEIEGRAIARSFWGKGWCDHLESFGDYSNRLPRGRTYARNGSVCHLGIGKGTVEAIVSGSDLYEVSVTIAPVKPATWDRLKKQCTGKIGSLIELLQGRLSDEVMAAVTNREAGLFPKPGEIHYRCNCPDWADMCKHIAAVMYGIGARLDSQPELLFLLRGVDHLDLITAEAAAGAIAGSGSRRARRRALSEEVLESVFDVELEESGVSSPGPGKKKTAAAPRKAASPKSAKASAFKPTGRSVTRLRKRHGMTVEEFATAIGVSAQSVRNWEKATGPITPRARGLAGLNRLHQKK